MLLSGSSFVVDLHPLRAYLSNIRTSCQLFNFSCNNSRLVKMCLNNCSYWSLDSLSDLVSQISTRHMISHNWCHLLRAD